MQNDVSYSALFKNKNYMLLWIGQSISQLGDSISYIAIPLLVYQLTNAPMNLTLSFVIETIPWIVLGPIAGVFIDRLNKKNVIIAMDIVRCLLVLLIFFTNNIYILYLLGFLIQCAAAIFAPARSSLIPQIVKKDYYLKAIGLSHVAFQTVQVIGPILAAAIIGFSGLKLAFIVDAITFLLAFILCISIKHNEKPFERKVKVPFFNSLKEGISYIKESKILKHVTYINLLKAAIQSFVIIGTLLFMKESVKFSSTQTDQLYSIMIGLTALGTIIGTWIIGLKEKIINRRMVILWGLSLQGFCFLLIALSSNIYIIGALFFLSGLALSGATSPVSAYYAEYTNDNIRGRVYSVTNSSLQLASIIAYTVAGTLGNYLNGSSLFIISGVLILISTPILLIITRTSLKVDTINEQKERAVQQ